MFGKNQYQFFYLEKKFKVVQGYFYVDGSRKKYKLCSFEEAGLNEQGELPKQTKTAEKRFFALVGKLYKEKK